MQVLFVINIHLIIHQNETVVVSSDIINRNTSML